MTDFDPKWPHGHQLRDGRKADSLTRFWERVRKGAPDECWIWLAARKPGPRQYGRFYINGTDHRAHRWIFEQINGPQPSDIDVCHSCDRPECVNPAHLFAGTRSDNMMDASRKTRLPMQVRPWNSFFGTERGKAAKPRGEQHHRAKLTTADVIQIRSLKRGGMSSSNVARQFNVSAGHVRKLCSGKLWSEVR